MRRKLFIAILISDIFMFSVSTVAQPYIGDHSIAKEEVIRSIPVEYIDIARTGLIIAYQHTSHGTHVSRGAFGLPDFKTGDDILFAISESEEAGKLDFRNNALASYAPEGIDASDLSRNETAFIQTTRNFLDAPENADVNVVMWSWCNIAGHDVDVNYLPGMDSLISEYSSEGTKIGTGEGQREQSVTFIFMTGHANTNANVGHQRPEYQAGLINDYCNAHGQFCLDYYSIDTHDMDDNYWEDAGDNGNSALYGGNFYEDWQNSHTLGEHYFENRKSPGGEVLLGSHTTQHITSDRKAYALWWNLARIAGWDGNLAIVPVTSINVSSSGGVTEMTTGATLQLSAEVLPSNTTNKSITWSVNDQTGSGTITQDGLLTAISAGTVNVIATAQDGSGIAGNMTITIQTDYTGLDISEHQNIRIYPNPGRDDFQIQNKGKEIKNVKVFDINGVEVVSHVSNLGGFTIPIHLTNNSSGVYLFVVETIEAVIYRRVIVL